MVEFELFKKEDVQIKFNKAMDNTTIKNKMKYMQTCIWNSLSVLADKVLEDTSILKSTEIYYFVWNFDNLKVA